MFSLVRILICFGVMHIFGWLYGFIGYALFFELVGMVMFYVFDLEILTPMDAIF